MDPPNILVTPEISSPPITAGYTVPPTIPPGYPYSPGYQPIPPGYSVPPGYPIPPGYPSPSGYPEGYPIPPGYSSPEGYPYGYQPRPPPNKNKIWYPAVIVYTVLVIIWLIGAIVSNAPPTTKLFNIVFGLIWAFAFWVLILMLCRKGETGWAMFVALFGLIVWGILIVLALFGFILFEGNPLTW